MELPSGEVYNISILTPLGYTAAVDNIQVAIERDATSYAKFYLTCVDIVANPSSNFWMHQIGVALGGTGNGQIDEEQLCFYLDLIEEHFNSNEINQVLIYEPSTSGMCEDKLATAKTLLNLRGNVGMIARARQQLMALLFNVASGNLSQTAIVSVEGATVSQAITYCDNLIDDTNGDHELAKDICDEINNNIMVAAGLRPLGTANIIYKVLPYSYDLGQNYPNPFNPTTRIKFSIESTSDVTLEVFNLMGQRVETLLSSRLEAGQHEVDWEGTDAPSGINFYRLTTEDFVATKKMMLIK